MTEAAFQRTFKFLIAVGRGIPIVTIKWLEAIATLGSIEKAPISKYQFTDEEFERRHQFQISKSTILAKTKPLFAGIQFFLTPQIRPVPNEMKGFVYFISNFQLTNSFIVLAIITCAGGAVLENTASYRKDCQTYVVSTVLDNRHWHKYRRDIPDVKIVSTEGVMQSLMRQKLELNTFDKC